MIHKVKDSEIFSNDCGGIVIILEEMYAHEKIMLNNCLLGVFYFNHCLN